MAQSVRAVAERSVAARQGPDTLEDEVLRTLSADERGILRGLVEQPPEALFSAPRV